MARRNDSIRDPVRRPGKRRLEAARDLVLALRARLEGGETVFDAVVDALVIAGLEMQAVIVGVGAPVAAIECVGGAEKYRRGHGSPSRIASLTKKPSASERARRG